MASTGLALGHFVELPDDELDIIVALLPYYSGLAETTGAFLIGEVNTEQVSTSDGAELVLKSADEEVSITAGRITGLLGTLLLIRRALVA